MPSLTKQQVNDIYSGIIAPQGGLYQPGAPVMLPPVGMGNNPGQSNSLALAKALMADPVGDTPAWLQLQDQIDTLATPNRLQPSPGAYGSGTGVSPQLAYTMGSPGANQGTGPRMDPGQQAIQAVIHGGTNPIRGGLSMLGGQINRMFPSDSNGMPIDSNIPTNSPAYMPSSSGGLAALGNGNQASGGLAALPPVQIASGRTVPVGTTGTAQGGHYGYSVQPNGSIVNTAGRVTATPSGPVGVAAVANAPSPAPSLNQIVYGQSHDFGPGYRPF